MDQKTNLKELSIKEALLLAAEKYPEPVEGWFWREGFDTNEKGVLAFVLASGLKGAVPFCCYSKGWFSHFAIEVPAKMRPMTRFEMMQKAIELDSLNRDLKDSIWLVSDENGSTYFPINYSPDAIIYYFARFDKDMNIIEGPYKFETPEEEKNSNISFEFAAKNDYGENVFKSLKKTA